MFTWQPPKSLFFLFVFSCCVVSKKEPNASNNSQGRPLSANISSVFFSAKPNSQFHTAIQKNCMVVGKKVDFIWQAITKGWGTEGWHKLFSFSFLLRPQALLSLGRVQILFPSANCPSGEWKFFVLRGCLRTPSGQKFFTLPQDNWPRETKFLLSLGTTRPAASGERKMKKVFAIPQCPHPLVSLVK